MSIHFVYPFFASFWQKLFIFLRKQENTAIVMVKLRSSKLGSLLAMPALLPMAGAEFQSPATSLHFRAHLWMKLNRIPV